uniref:glycoside hydrolase family 97 N-terminal domain-containing protein n=1 Tax=Pontiella sp. TaxID=2837462 RepID=UPI003566D085
MKRTLFIALSIGVVSFLPSIGADAAEIRSPDKRIVLSTHAENGQVAYSVEFNGTPVIAKSRLGVELEGGAFSGPVEVSGSKTGAHDERWKPVWGQFGEVRDHYYELTLDVAEVNAPKRTMQVVLRAYDDGIAFRYVFPSQKGLANANFAKEWSAVSMVSKDPVAWYAATSTTLANEVPFGKIGKPCRTPFTVQLSDDCFVSLHEAAVVNSSDAMLSLGADRRTLTYSSSCNQEAGSV